MDQIRIGHIPIYWTWRYNQKFNVTFNFIDSSNVKQTYSQQVFFGKSVNPPTDILEYIIDDFQINRFAGWNHDTKYIKRDLVVEPIYEEVEELVLDELNVEDNITTESLSSNNIRVI